MSTDVYGDATRRREWASVRLRIDGMTIVDADAPGIERPLRGLTLLEAARVGGEPLAVEALASALGQVFRAAPAPGRIAVAMSGGVDSAVALLRAAPNAVGVTLRLWQDPAAPNGERACCSPTAVAAARVACHALGLPHVTVDLREAFVGAVVNPFVAGYEAGETPNPCIRCNGSFRFEELVAFAERAGAEELWTGHYARIVERDGERFVARGADLEKDQSYMLATVDRRLLDRIRFPLGDQSKADTREEAARAGLAAATRGESQEACFLGGDDYRAFLVRRGLRAVDGEIVDTEGRLVGTHEGYWRYTAGQRRGLGVASSRALYVLGTDRTANRVIVGPREAGAVRSVEVDGDLFAPVERGEAKLRYRSAAVPAAVTPGNGGFTLELATPAHGVAPGQGAVVYDGDVVVAAGVISNAA